MNHYRARLESLELDLSSLSSSYDVVLLSDLLAKEKADKLLLEKLNRAVFLFSSFVDSHCIVMSGELHDVREEVLRSLSHDLDDVLSEVQLSFSLSDGRPENLEGKEC